MSKLLLVDDERLILQSLLRLFRAVPCQVGQRVFSLEVETFTSPQEALERAREESFDLVLTDYRMPEMDGIAFLKQFKAIQPDAVRLILTGYADLNALMQAINEVGVERFIGKPWNDYELVSAVAQCLIRQELAVENRRLANLVRLECGDITPEKLEAERLESLEPGITQVNWGPDGSVLLEPGLARDLGDSEGRE